jgi:hypothetical protein
LRAVDLRAVDFLRRAGLFAAFLAAFFFGIFWVTSFLRSDDLSAKHERLFYSATNPIYLSRKLRACEEFSLELSPL